MRPILFSIYLEFWIIICCSANIESNAIACIENYELSFFCDAQQFDQAKKACQKRGSYLVKISNANMTEIISDTIHRMNCTEVNFHAGATADKSRKWTWLDGSEVYLPNSVGYQNWQSGQPNDVGDREDCMTIKTGTLKWFDAPCAGTANGVAIEKRYYICQKNITLNIKIKRLSNNALECSAFGICVNQVKWRRNVETVSTSQDYSVYQMLSSGTSILHYENATINHEGEYSCVTWVIKNEQNKVAISEFIQINGTPTIEVVTHSACNSSLIIYWHPNNRAIGFPHRIVVNDSVSGELTKEVIETPIKDVLQKTEIGDVQPFTVYNIQISACENEEICKNENTVNATATTESVVIKNATMLSDNDTCIVTWNWPYNISVVFKIIVHLNSGNKTSEVNVTGNKLSYSFKMQPEQAYQVQIHPTGSTTFCPGPVNVIGTCKGIDIHTTTTSDQVTSKIEQTNLTTSKIEQTNLTNIIVPVVSAIIVMILLAVAFVVYKMKTGTTQAGQQNTKPSTNRADDTADYTTVGDGEIIAVYSTVNDQPAVYVNYQQNSLYENIEANQHNITDVYETPIGGK